MPHHPPGWPEKANPDLMTAADVARRLNASESFVYGVIAAGRLKHHRPGRGQGGIRVSEEQLADFLRRTERGGEQAVDDPTPPPRPMRRFTLLPPS
jgi:excisionase family DNA binding protein